MAMLYNIVLRDPFGLFGANIYGYSTVSCVQWLPLMLRVLCLAEEGCGALAQPDLLLLIVMLNIIADAAFLVS